MSKIIIPYCPRYPQDEIHEALEAYRFVVLVAHRRMGKTVCVINHLIKQALCFAGGDGKFAYVAPFRNQAKSIAWSYLKRFTGPLPERRFNESDLIVTLHNGAEIRIFGADNPDALRGMYFDGVVLDEVAQMSPEVWEEIIRPALADRNGFAVFIGTPKGINLFHDLYVKACAYMSQGNPDWFAALYRADETGALPADELAKLKAESSDNAWRQEFLCDFTAAADDAFIGVDLAVEAAERDSVVDMGAPLLLGLDVARFGSDRTVAAIRRGRDARSKQWPTWQGKDTMQTAAEAAQLIDALRPKLTFVDGVGVGGGVVDRLRQLGYSVIEVNGGAKPRQEARFINKRAEMWSTMRDWLREGGAIPQMPELKSDLAAPTYHFDAAHRLALEPKEKMRARLGRSPDLADALALTFAQPVAHTDVSAQFMRTQAVATFNYNPLD